jgi:hypothetical protein
VVVKAMSEHGVRLNIKKPTLRRWRLEFARHLRDQNIAANATARAMRGEVRESKPKPIYHTERRGASTGQRRREEPGKLVAARKALEQRWQAIRASLIGQGRQDLAEEVGRFLDALPPRGTGREQLAPQLSPTVLDGRLQYATLSSP